MRGLRSDVVFLIGPCSELLAVCVGGVAEAD